MTAASGLEMDEGSWQWRRRFGTQRPSEAPPGHGVSRAGLHRKELGNRKRVLAAAFQQ